MPGRDESTRALWNAVMRYEDFDRLPVLHWKAWPETYERWYEEGLPADEPEHAFFGASPLSLSVGVNVNLHPPFEEEVLEETEDYRIVRQADGVVAKDWKNRSCIPHFIDFTFKDSSGWEEYEKRLQPDPARIPADMEERMARAAGADVPVSVPAGSMIGWIRNWMGVENMTFLAHDDPGLFKEMVDTIADLVVWGLEQVLPRVKVDIGWGWEDICFRSGPLVSPSVFAEAAVPAYRKIAETLGRYGVDFYLVDCDGLIDDLVPLWLEAGVNVMFPIEIGVWDADPASFRRAYGEELRIIGGIDKRVLERGREAVDAEIERRLPLMREGGYIPLPDHLITPDTPLENYRYYLDAIRGLRF